MSDPKRFWNDRYAQAGFAYGTEPNDFLAEVAEQIPPGELLCLAEGEGRNAVFLASRGHAVTAMDLSETGLAKAQSLAAERGVTLKTEVGDLSDYPIEQGRFSAIVAIWMHLPKALRAKVLADAVQAVLPGGVIVVESYTPAQLAFGNGGPKDVNMLVEPDDLRAELAGLELDRFEACEREVDEGPFHGGMSAVVRALARKPAG